MAAAAARKLVEVDGSLMEGGGQILRMSASLSAILGTPVRIFNIRGGRSKPGLKSQHLTGIQLVRDLTNAELDGGELNSSEIKFQPRSAPSGGDHLAEIGTAGAVTLLAQVSLPCLLYSGGRPARLDLRGGTNADMAPMAEYYSRALLLTLRRQFGLEGVEFEVLCKGYFPRGGGRAMLSVAEGANNCLPLKSVTMTERGDVRKVTITASVAGTLPFKLAEEMAHAAKDVLSKKLPQSVEYDVECFKEKSATGNGSSVFVCAETANGLLLADSAVGSPKVRPRQSGEEAANALVESLANGACVDRWMQDQLIIFMALAKGKSRVLSGPLTLHTETAIDIAGRFTDAQFRVEDRGDGTRVIECDGIGLASAALGN